VRQDSAGISSRIARSCSGVATLSMPPGLDFTTGLARKAASAAVAQPLIPNSSSP
jgi:hypothetical protein